MINYEFALKLKNAGFPLSMKNFDDYCRHIFCPDVEEEEKKYAYAPSLSELIEKCGDGFINLMRHERQRYTAYGRLGLKKLFGHGETLEEAVANLWLELNNKK